MNKLNIHSSRVDAQLEKAMDDISEIKISLENEKLVESYAYTLTLERTLKNLSEALKDEKRI